MVKIPPISTKRTFISHPLTAHKKYLGMWRWKSRIWFGTDTKIWRG